MRHNILEALHQDHINMSRIAALIDTELGKLDEGGQPDYELLEDIMVYVTSYPDTYHHPTEDVVFTALKRVAPETSAQVDALLAEHQTLIGAGRTFLKAIRAVEEEALVARTEFHSQGLRYLEVLTDHMNKEETGLFRLAADRLGAEDWAVVDAQVRTLSDPLFGETVQNDFRRLRQRISTHAPMPDSA